MDPERPPEIDAEYRLIRGPWPRWMLQFSLLKVFLRAAGVVLLCMALFGGAILLIRLL